MSGQWPLYPRDTAFVADQTAVCLSGSRSCSERFGEERNLFLLPQTEHQILGRHSCSLITVPNALPRFHSPASAILVQWQTAKFIIQKVCGISCSHNRIKSSFLWNVMSRSMVEVFQRFGSIYCCHPQGRRLIYQNTQRHHSSWQRALKYTNNKHYALVIRWDIENWSQNGCTGWSTETAERAET